MTKQRVMRVLAAACAAAAILLLRAPFKELTAIPRQEFCAPERDFFVEGGEALLHGVRLENVSWQMPGASVSNALVCHGAGPAAARRRALALPACALLVFGLGWLLHSAACGGLALLGFALVLDPTWFRGERWLSVGLVMLAAYLTAWRAQRPTLARTLALAAGLAVNLTVISTLFLFGPLLAAWEWFTRRKETSRRTLAAQAAILCLAPALFLSPWLWMNRQVHGEAILFEKGRADSNVIAGALGLVVFPRGDAHTLVELPPGRSAAAWAVAEVLRHPLRFIDAYARRAFFVLRLYPILILAGLPALWPWRERQDRRQVALLAAYFAAILCLMPVLARYLHPLWPVLVVLAAGLLSDGARLPEARLGRGPAGGLAAALLLVCLSLAGFSLALAAAYPARLARPDPLGRELARHPDDPWLWAQRGNQRIASGQTAAAAADFEQAYRLDPQRDYEVRQAWAAFLSGGKNKLLPVHPAGNADFPETRARVLNIFHDLRAGDEASARTAWRGVLAVIGGLDAPGSDMLWAAVRDILKPSPVSENCLYLEGLLKLCAQDSASLRESISQRLAAGYLEAARSPQAPQGPELEALKRALAAGGAPPMTGSSGKERLRYELLARVARLWPGDAALWLEVADSARLAHRHAAGSDALARVVALSQDPATRLYAARAYAAIGEGDAALKLFQELARSSPKNGAARLELAETAARFSRKDLARKTLKQAQGLALSPGDWRWLLSIQQELGDLTEALKNVDRMLSLPGAAPDLSEYRAIIQQEMGDLPGALKTWDGLIASSGAEPRRLTGRAVARALSGKKEGALEDLRRSLKLAPGRPDASLTLLSLLEPPGAAEEIRRVCRAALPPGAADTPIRGLLRAKCP